MQKNAVYFQPHAQKHGEGVCVDSHLFSSSRDYKLEALALPGHWGFGFRFSGGVWGGHRSGFCLTSGSTAGWPGQAQGSQVSLQRWPGLWGRQGPAR